MAGPLDLFKEEMTSEQTSVKINAIHRLGIVATLIGPSSVKRDLLPMLESMINEEEDEVLFAIAKVLGSLFPDYTLQFENIIPILETLAAFEETVVREEAVKSIVKISSKLSSEHNAGVIIPCVLRLSNGDWFTSRVSAIHIMAKLYDRSGIHKDTLRKKFIDLSHEQTPMIKRAVAGQLGTLSEKMSTEHFMIEMMPIFKSVSSGDQDPVRMISISSLIKISKNLSKEMNKTHMIPILIQLTRDRAWGVRKTLSLNFANIAKATGREIADSSLINIFSSLLLDAEGEVRVAAVNSFIEFVKGISPSKLEGMSQQIMNLTKDTLPLVRVGATEILAFIVQHVKKDTVKKVILPSLLQNMESEEDDEVKVELVECLKNCGLAIGQEFFNVVSQINIGKLMAEKNWRVRQVVMNMIVELAQSFKAIELFEVHLQEFLFQYLDDPVYAIRSYGNSILGKILKIESANWVMTSLIPKIEKQINQEESYNKKITALYTLEVICNNFSGNARSKAITLLLQNSKDKVPNVRMVAVKIFNNVYPGLEGAEQSSVRTSISAMIGDSDKDVRDVSKQFVHSFS